MAALTFTAVFIFRWIESAGFLHATEAPSINDATHCGDMCLIIQDGNRRCPVGNDGLIYVAVALHFKELCAY